MVGSLSTGNLQKLAIITAVCHHPRLLVLDEPVSDLDPIVRARLLTFLLELLQDDQATIIVSSHVLRDVEKVVDWVVCLEAGRVVTDEALDDLKERYSEWRVTARGPDLPDRFAETFVLAQETGPREALLRVDCTTADLGQFRDAYQIDVHHRSLNLEDLFPLLVGELDR